jgi:hypothetical protein
MIKKFIKAPIEEVVIEAIQFLDNVESFAEIRNWAGNRFYFDYQESPFVFLESPDFKTFYAVRKGDWIVKTKQGNFAVYDQNAMDAFNEMAR